jgi:hypothetical protein
MQRIGDSRLTSQNPGAIGCWLLPLMVVVRPHRNRPDVILLKILARNVWRVGVKLEARVGLGPGCRF